jgi:hypothetical protein
MTSRSDFKEGFQGRQAFKEEGRIPGKEIFQGGKNFKTGRLSKGRKDFMSGY